MSTASICRKLQVILLCCCNAQHELSFRTRSISVPGKLASIFDAAFRYFNTVQSECFPTAYGSDVNMVCIADVFQKAMHSC